MEEICFRACHYRGKNQYFFCTCTGCDDCSVWYGSRGKLWLPQRENRCGNDADFRYICLAFPGLVFAMAVAAVLGGGISNAVIALAVISWPKYSRVARSQTLALKNSPYIHASVLAGDSSVQIIWRHILPNIVGPILVTAMLDIGTMMMELAGLSFLGLGAQPPTAEWGSMMSTGRSMLQTYPWIVLSPGIAIFISVAIFNLLGDTVRDYLDPRSSRLR